MKKRIGKFDNSQIISEYKFFHYDVSMSWLKTISGIFFVIFNFWILWFLYHFEIPIWSLIIFIYSCIIINSNFAISLAHDLMHSTRRMDRLFANILLIQNGFFYLKNDHLYIHHRHVATMQDPATAMYGENLYKYLFRSIITRLKITFIPGPTFPLKDRAKIILSNYMYCFACIFYLCIASYISYASFIYLILNYVSVTFIYESITYIQHYGLKRKAINSYKNEEIQLQHSWNCFYKISAYMHYMMTIHSIHHLKNDMLETTSTFFGNEMPKPFAIMMVTAWFPRRWARLMDDQKAFK